MKAGIHPNYRDVCFQDMSNGFKFVTRSCANAKEMIKMGEATAEEVIPKIKSLLPFFSNSCQVHLTRKGRKDY